MGIVERGRERFVEWPGSLRAGREVLVRGPKADTRHDDGFPLGYEANWTKLLGELTDAETIKKTEIDGALNANASPIAYENKIELLRETGTDVDAVKKADVAATKLAAQELCRLMSPTLCECPGNPLKCHAVKVFMQPALSVVRALRRSHLLR